jgi:phenylacetate-CoA ligase
LQASLATDSATPPSPLPATTKEEQVRKLRHLVNLSIDSNPFYREKLQGAGITGGSLVRNIEDFTQRVPLTTKHEIVRDLMAHPPYGRNLAYPLERYVRCHQTSGSTAVPVRWLDTRESWDGIVDNWIRVLEAASVHSQDRFFFAFSFGPFLGFWSAIEAVHRLGMFCFPGGGMTSTARLGAVLDNQITVLCCTPTYAQHLGEVAREKKISLKGSRVRLIVVAGEAGGSVPAVRARIESLWPGARVFDHHGMTEVGPVTYQCPAEPCVLHVIESAYLAEVIDPQTGRAAVAGEVGELVLTTLDRIGSPLLRYRTGDLVKARRPGMCQCGRPDLALAGGIIGRVDDMVVIRGVNVFPSTVEEIIRQMSEITEYRVVLDSRGAMLEMRLEVETASECTAAAEIGGRLQDYFHRALNLRVDVQTVPPNTLPRFEMKARRWVRITEGMTG